MEKAYEEMCKSMLKPVINTPRLATVEFMEWYSRGNKWGAGGKNENFAEIKEILSQYKPIVQENTK